MMTPEQRARLDHLAETLDTAVAARPDLLTSPTGFAIGTILSAIRSDPGGTWAMVAGFADLLAAAVLYVNDGRGEPEAIVTALVPA